MEVTLEDVQELATYCIRTFSLKRSGYLERREVRQFQFTAWPDHGVPDHPTPFLMFLKRVRAMNPPEAGPLIVHCSAGVGRTGLLRGDRLDARAHAARRARWTSMAT
ncbi:hypothetical protein MRX96_012640 [Rhipicephalus microplus]